MLVEDGAIVAKGQLLAVLSNADLQLSTLARQTEVEQQINNMRSQELALTQTRLANERAVLEAELAAEQGAAPIRAASGRSPSRASSPSKTVQRQPRRIRL